VLTRGQRRRKPFDKRKNVLPRVGETPLEETCLLEGSNTVKEGEHLQARERRGGAGSGNRYKQEVGGRSRLAEEGEGGRRPDSTRRSCLSLGQGRGVGRYRHRVLFVPVKVEEIVEMKVVWLTGGGNKGRRDNT